MLEKPVKIAVIGCGGYAHQLIIRIQTTPLYGTVTAVTSRDLDSEGARYCKAHGINVFQSVEELLTYGEFEVVVNPTPIHLHADISKQCLAAGFPVWMEKPPVATVQELDDLNAAAMAAELPVAVCFNSLFSYRVQQLKAELLAGTYGKIKRVKSLGAWVRTDAYFGRNNWAGALKRGDHWILDGDINNPLAHVVCNGLFFAGAQQATLANPLSVEAELYRANQIESEDTSAVRIQTAEGIEVLSWLTLACKDESDPVTVIETEQATIKLINLEKVEITWHDGRVEFRDSYKENRIEMIEHLCRSLRGDEPLIGELANLRPFTLSVNAAFESVGSIHSIPKSALDCVTVRETETQVAIEGMGAILKQAYESNALFSEIGVSWAHKSEVFETAGYTHFPVRFKVEAAEPLEALSV
jgi:predicted dehydrogenase